MSKQQTPRTDDGVAGIGFPPTGQLVGEGRFLLRQKRACSTRSVAYTAVDLVGDMEVTLELYPDDTLATGYRVGDPDPMWVAVADLPDLCAPDLYRDERPDVSRPAAASLGSRLWRALRSRLASGAEPSSCPH